jgi:GDP-D-mannose dehydratase
MSEGKGNAEKAQHLLGWAAEARMKGVMATMVKAKFEMQGRRVSDKQNLNG